MAVTLRIAEAASKATGTSALSRGGTATLRVDNLWAVKRIPPGCSYPCGTYVRLDREMMDILREAAGSEQFPYLMPGLSSLMYEFQRGVWRLRSCLYWAAF